MRYRAATGRGLLFAAAIALSAVAWGAPPVPSPAPPPVTVALTLDTSGSVGTAQLARARDLALAILAALPDGSEVAVLAFDDQSRVVVPRTSQAEEVRRQLASLKVGGRFTALHDALYDASRYVREAPGARKAIVLITDGLDENSALSLEDGLRVATDAQIPVFAVGVGPHPEERVLRRIAKLTGGQYVAFDRARGSELAALIAAAPSPASAAAALPNAGSAVPTPTGHASTAAPRAPAPLTSPRLVASGPARALWLAAILTAMTVGAVLLLVRRRRPAPACATCGRPLPSGSVTCPSCAVVPVRIPPRTPPVRMAEPDLSPTVLSRMNTTEEYLERTITLQERPVLAITRGPGVGQVFNLSETTATSIGRSRANDIQVEDVSISGQHCRVRSEDGHFVVHDLRSTNGTLVNDKRISRHILEEGDVIRIGETALQYRREMKRG